MIVMRIKRWMLLLVLVFSLFGSERALAQRTFFEGKTKIEDPFSLRDPFKKPLFDIEGQKRDKVGAALAKAKEVTDEEIVSKMQITDLKVVGILIGKERRAMIEGGAGKKTLLIKEGMLIGPQQAEIKAILPGGIVVVEKLKNIYDESEYLETIIPLSIKKK